MANMIVAGGFGILGCAVVDDLIAQGDQVVALDMMAAPAAHPATPVIGSVDLADDTAVVAAFARASV